MGPIDEHLLLLCDFWLSADGGALLCFEDAAERLRGSEMAPKLRPLRLSQNYLEGVHGLYRGNSGDAKGITIATASRKESLLLFLFAVLDDDAKPQTFVRNKCKGQ